MSGRGWVYVVAAAFLVFCAWRAFEWAAGIGAARCELRHTAAADTAAVEVNRRAAASADASTSMLDYLRANLPPIQSQTYASIERVRTVYRDHPIHDSGCVRPAGVQSELDAARARANAAAGAM